MSLLAVRAVRAATLVAALCAVVPAAAEASTWTVDDDGAQCPNAGFTRIQDAVNHAAPWDTVKICDGTYRESSQPVQPSAQLPIQAGSRNGVTITKPLTIKGAGASKVTIQPDPAVATSLAGTAPYLRDGGGNVISVLRQSAGSTADNENWVSISGVTVTSPGVYAEAGIAFFNTSGTVESSVVGPLTRATDAAELAARPHGWGIVQTNHLVGTDAGGITRQLNVTGTLVTGYQSGGVLFDGARGADGAATLLERSGIRAYGRLAASTIQGSGPDALIPQTGVRWHAGQRGSLQTSTITGNFFTPDPRQSVGVLLTDAETGMDPANPTERAWWALENRITGNGYGMFNATIGNDAVRQGAPASATSAALGLENWWGCSTGPIAGAPSTTDATTSCQGISGDDATPAASIQRGATRASAPFLPPVPAPTADAKPALTFREPAPAGTLVAGQQVEPVLTATDDFGVRSVKLALDGTELGTKAKAPYEFAAVRLSHELIGKDVTFTAEVTDSAGQVTTASRTFAVKAPAGYEPLTITAATPDLGAVLLGQSATTEVTVANTGRTDVVLDTIAVDGTGFTSGTGCAAGDRLAPGEACAHGVSFAPAAVGLATGTVAVGYTAPGATGPEAVSLSGSGSVAPPPAVTGQDPPAAPGPAPAPPTTPRAAGPAPLGRVALRETGKVTASRRVDLGTFTCGTTACTVRLTGTMRRGGRTYRVTASRKAGAGARVKLELRLTTSAHRALRASKRRAGKLRVTVRIAAGGRTSTRTQTVDLKA